MILARRTFLKLSLGGAAGAALPVPALAAQAGGPPSLAGQIGVTTGSFMGHLSVEPQPGKLVLLELPRYMRQLLDMRVIDLMTRTLASLEPGYLEQLREQAQRHDCLLTNLKMNLVGADMASPDAAARREALEQYKRTIDAAGRLGCRWVRPALAARRGDLRLLIDGFRALIDYAAPLGISLLVENNGWIRDDPEAIVALIDAVGPGLAAAPDTGNWTDGARYEGLARAFPHAVTCDFKAYPLRPDGSHEPYDLQRCFQIAWDAGFRGPWCLEHFNETLDGLWRGFRQLREMIRHWTAQQP